MDTWGHVRETSTPGSSLLAAPSVAFNLISPQHSLSVSQLQRHDEFDVATENNIIRK
jgi:hypothetical protein